MRKFINKLLVTLGAGVLITFTACEEGDTVFDQIDEQEQRGAVLRTISIVEAEALYDVGNQVISGGGFSIILQEQDQEGGDLLSSVDVYIGFRDNTAGGTDNDRDEVLAETIPASAFSKGEFGLPRTEYAITAAAMQTALGLSGDQIFGGDQFTIRFELNLTDGRSFSSDDNTGTLTQTFFRSPFLYTTNIVCAPSIPTAGDWTFDLQDSYGDGWNGATLTVTVDGTATEVGMDSGSAAQVIVNVPAGSAVISIVYNSGAWDSEVTFQITSANGNTVVDLGPNPPAGEELLDYCPNNL